MSGEAEQLNRQAAYLDTIRGLYRRERGLGFVACLAGAMIIVYCRFRAPELTSLLWGGVVVIALGWSLFVYAIIRRILWVRAHPFVSDD